MTQIIGSGISGLINNAMSGWRESQAREENYKIGEKAAQNADKRTRALYWDLQSPQALLEQYKAAGLSPSMMFSGGGSGAQPSAGAQGGGAGGISPNVFPMSQMDVANLRLINAQEEKTKAETNRITGNNERGRAEIDNMLQELNNKWLDGETKALDIELKNIDYSIKAATGETEIKIKDQTLDNLVSTGESIRASLKSLIAKGKIDEESADSIIEYYRNRVIEQEASIFLKKTQAKLNESGIVLNEAQAQKLLNDIVVDNEAIRLRGDELELNKKALNAKVEQWAKENGLAERGQNVKIAEVVNDYIQQATDKGVDLIKAILPFAKPIRKISGL